MENHKRKNLIEFEIKENLKSQIKHRIACDICSNPPTEKKETCHGIIWLEELHQELLIKEEVTKKEIELEKSSGYIVLG